MLPGFQLVLRNLVLRIHIQNLRRVGTELGEEVVRLIVFVLPSKPLLVHYLLNVRQGLNLLPVVAGQIEDQ